MPRALSSAILLALALVLSACGSDSSGHVHGEDGHSHSHGGHGQQGSVPGSAADPAEATKKVVIKADELSFAPRSIEAKVGEVVTFVVRNVGKLDHELVLGDEAYQKAHETEMQGGHHSKGMDNAVTVAPGETARVTWHFDEAGEVLYGCHLPGHYSGGMRGTVAVG